MSEIKDDFDKFIASMDKQYGPNATNAELARLDRERRIWTASVSRRANSINRNQTPPAGAEKTIVDVINGLAEFYEPKDAQRWLYAPQKLLGNKSPIELIGAGQIDKVIRLLDQLRDGVYL